MKYKVLVLVVVSAFLLFGCSNGNSGATNAGTTVPNTSQQTPVGTTAPSGEEPTLPSNIVQGEELPNGATVLPDGTIILPEIEFDESFHQQGSITPVTKPSEPEPTEAPDEDEPEPTEPEDTTMYIPSDTLPEDVWE